jgi:peroxiredoxin Q/BCP
MKPSKFKALLLASCLWIITQPSLAATADKLTVGAMAPNFTLYNQNQKSISLSDYKGHWVVVYFYPKD